MTQSIAKAETTGEVQDYGASLMDVISRAARDPSVDIDKMERLIAMQERVQNRDAELAFTRAMNAAQAEMRPISANASNPQTRSKYATFDKLDGALRPIYTAHGFSMSYDEGESPKADHIRVLCYVGHIEGHTRTYHRDMPADGKGAKGGDVMTKTHAAGAAGSYGARYLLKGIWNVAVGEDDNDGNNSRAPSPTVSQAQYEELTDLMAKAGVSEDTICTARKVEAVALLPASDFVTVRNKLKATITKKAAAAEGAK